MNWRMASLQELVTVRYHDDQASLMDKIAAEQEIIRRQRKKRAGKPVRLTGRMAVRR